MSKWIRKGDKVGVIAGNDKGKVGVVLSRMKNRVIVQGVNIRKKHQKAQSQELPSRIIDIECPIHISNVMFCGANDKMVKVFVKDDESEGKTLFYREEGKEIKLRRVKEKQTKK